jgi:hypothetical protein
VNSGLASIFLEMKWLIWYKIYGVICELLTLRSTEYISFFAIGTQFSERKGCCNRRSNVTETYRYY